VRQLRQENVQTPALFLSALGGIDDKVLGLRAGGDDYLVKPFALAELSGGWRRCCAGRSAAADHAAAWAAGT